MKNILSKSIFAIFLATCLIGAVSAQEPEALECQVLESEAAELQDGSMLHEGMNLEENSSISTGSEGYAVLMCNDGFREISENSEGSLTEISNRTEEMDTDIPDIKEDVGIEDVLNRTDEIEENLQGVNEVIEEVIPERIRSLIMGDKVNFQVDNTTIGIATNESGVTGVQENGYEEPTLEISTSEETLKQIIESKNAPETFREAYHGDGISVEARSLKNKMVFGIVNTTSRIYGFVNQFI